MEEPDVERDDSPEEGVPTQSQPHETRHLKGCVLRLAVQDAVSNTTLTVHSVVRGQGVMSEFVRSTEGELRAIEQALQKSNGRMPPQIVGCSARWLLSDPTSRRVRVTMTVSRDERIARGKGVHTSQIFAMALAYEDACIKLEREPEEEQSPILLPNPFSFSR